MSELIQKNDNHATIRWKLLTGASALALASYVMTSDAVRADDTHRPLVWLEAGGQFSRLEDNQEIYSPPFLALEPSQFSSPQADMRAPRYGLDTEGAISFQPEDSSWIFSASIRYGRSGSKNHFHQQSYPSSIKANAFVGYKYQVPFAAQDISVSSKNSENHAIVDFQAGKDLGIGLFGHDNSTSLSLGVRFAQFQSNSNATLNEDPDWHPVIRTLTVINGRPFQIINQAYHTYEGQFEAERSFHGVGPSLSWKTDMPFAGNEQDGALTLNWGVNASFLFGRQRARTQHQESAQYHSAGRPPLGNRSPGRHSLYHHPTDAPAYYSTRSANVTVPNIGGFAGLSFEYPNAKISLGYRADWFFNAIDGGIDAAKKEDRGFYGPYASISIGLGD